MRRERVLWVKLFKLLFPESSVDSICEQWFKYTRKEGNFIPEDEAVLASPMSRSLRTWHLR
uniref:Uncharacterized protein n=1 Tax=Hyaloperonospora arabidopsidis (strain Emoy2) TaxID=559515 RepID=M4BAY7_HYAAE